MYNSIEIHKDLFWIGANDRKLKLFENMFPTPKGISYNSFVLLDEKNVIFDTVDKSVSNLFFENLNHVLKGKEVHYIVINHVEPDHSGALEDLLSKFPSLKIICNEKTVSLIKQFFNPIDNARFLIVKEGDKISTGKHELVFYMAPMVHWPEVMVTYEKITKTLFSADAFGTFNALSGALFADEYLFESEYLDDARRYYANIIGKYGNQVKSLLKKLSPLEISTLCPLHGPVWRKNITFILEKYKSWSNYISEERGVVIAYGSVYAYTENAVEILASKLVEKGMPKVKLFDVSDLHPSFIIAEVFKYSHIVFASSTYNGGIFPNMETLLRILIKTNIQNKVVAIIENGSWSPSSGNQIKKNLSGLKNLRFIEDTLTIKSTLKKNQLKTIEKIASSLISNKTI